jgi:hypothetical protein
MCHHCYTKSGAHIFFKKSVISERYVSDIFQPYFGSNAEEENTRVFLHKIVLQHTPPLTMKSSTLLPTSLFQELTDLSGNELGNLSYLELSFLLALQHTWGILYLWRV